MKPTIALQHKSERILANWDLENLPFIEPLAKYNPTFEQLKEERKAGICRVFNGGARWYRTIFSCHNMRYVYRAWHDSLHIKHNTPFDFKGELHIAAMQEKEAIALGIAPYDAKLLRLDLELHIRHYYQHKKHPEFQTRMINDFMNYGYSVIQLNDYSTTGNFANTKGG